MSFVTVVGGRGFIGSHLVRELDRQGIPNRVLSRDEPFPAESLGDVVYCAGITADFRTQPFRTVRAHVSDLAALLERGGFRRIVYLSSTRVYAGASATSEDAPLTIRPAVPDHLYNASKIMGESLVLSTATDSTVLRLSNVFGLDPAGGSFLSQVLREVAIHGRVTLRTALDSEKDYVGVQDVVAAILGVLARGRRGIYNVASGRNTRHDEIARALRERSGAAVDVAPEAPRVTFPAIDTHRITTELGFAPRSLLDALPGLIEMYRAALRGV